MKRESTKVAVLRRAIREVNDRGPSYGPPVEGLTTVARLWSVLLGCNVTPWQVALCLDALKTARILVSPGHLDSWVDKCGYSALGAEVAPIDPFLFVIPPPPERRAPKQHGPKLNERDCESITHDPDGVCRACNKPTGHDGWHESTNVALCADFTWPQESES